MTTAVIRRRQQITVYIHLTQLIVFMANLDLKNAILTKMIIYLEQIVKRVQGA